MSEPQQSAQHETAGIHVRGVVLGAAAIALGIGLAALASYFLWKRWSVQAEAVPSAASPELQSAPQQERARYFAEKQHLLTSWGWIDKQRGIARIPVDEAMRIMASTTREQK
ncbi:hypothetical protein [Noviherbaspirillum sp.]|uniref:hypothetical protein n=1 Tax=Noviherbaspirillum sp. TaxID=1926288 RepID=UPI002B460F19|nr:hypothetical protein [Noviherbaspirillum sp.]HJV79461.1 hypothetical protein [Noviherbaspirillum sp.]